MILVQLLLNKYKVFTPPKSFNTRYSIAKYIMRYYQNEEVVILEYGAYRKGEIKELTSYFPPKFAVITGITKQHVGLFGSMENLVTAKSELIQALPEDGIVFANGDDSTVLKMVKDANKKVIYFSFNEPRCPIKKPRLKRYGQIEFNFGGKIISTRIVGKHYLTNILGAITVAKYLGIKDNDISEALNTFVPNELFVQIRHHQSGASIIDDSGTSNPKGFEASLAIVKHLKKTTNILIFSGIVDLGNDSSELHSKLAKQAGKVFQKVLYTGKEGVVEFRDIFEQELSTSEVEINDVLNNADKNTVILIEGRIPIHLYKRLKGEINGSAI
jgi:UDP-N-acetylmuramoyl-tripeptide--D-alanyl-D-alanine ligase